MGDINYFDNWLAVDGPVAAVLREELEPVLGDGAVVFPPTFAPPEKGQSPSYVVDETSEGKVAIIDTVGAQANRMEPLFKRAPYAGLVPEAKVRVGEREVHLLDAGHRAADALVRFSSKKDELGSAFEAIERKGQATDLAKLAPTSLLFGVWDSRGTGVKIPRLLGSTIRAYGAETLHRSAQYFSAFEKDETDAWSDDQDFLSAQGFSDAPAGVSLGGIVARKGIRRETVLNLVALRALAGKDAEETKRLQRYVLGLALVAMTAPPESFLREGCLLVRKAGEEMAPQLVQRTGERKTFKLSPEEAFEYAQTAAKAFGVGPAWGETVFEVGLVTAAAEDKKKAKAAKKAAKG
ncbi:MAG TPA: type I-U CRISPR-associated protein Cas7 [Solibacterales bacterium]|nr:type I-U CRISPR-associated protein Cas7 [Bryobacterales bacterium]